MRKHNTAALSLKSKTDIAATIVALASVASADKFLLTLFIVNWAPCSFRPAAPPVLQRLASCQE